MAIYTGNNGRLYMARRERTGLQPGQELTLTLSEGATTAVNQTFDVITVTGIGGEGRGAKMRALEARGATASNRQVRFKVVVAGSGYDANDLVYLSQNLGGGRSRRRTENFSVSSTITRGIDNEKELLNESYRVAKIRDWNFSSTSEVIETTALGDVTKTFSPSITSGEGSATLMFYEEEYGALAGGQNTSANRDIFELGEILFPTDTAPSVIMSLAVDGGINSEWTGGANVEVFKTNFVFNAYITGASVGVSYGEVVTVNTTFTVDGPLIARPSRPGQSLL